MKQSLTLLSLALVTLTLFISGCSKPDVKEVRPNCVSSDFLINEALAKNPQLTKKDLDGRVVEIYGSVWEVRRQDKYKTPRIAFAGRDEENSPGIWPSGNREKVLCLVKNGLDPQFQGLKTFSEGAVVRGYGEVVYDKFGGCYVLLLHDAEIMEVFPYNGFFSKDLEKPREGWYTADNRVTGSSSSMLVDIQASLRGLLPFAR